MMSTLLGRIKDNKLLSTASRAFVINLSYAAISLILGLIMARILGANGLGIYDYAESWVEILMILAIFGFDRLLIRNLPRYENQQRWDLTKGILRFASSITLSLALIFAICFSLFFIVWLGGSDFLSRLSNLDWTLNQNIFLISCLLAMLLLPLRVGLLLLEGMMQGLQQVVKSLLPNYILRPFILAFCASYFLLFAAGTTPPYLIILLHILATALALLFGILRFLPHIPSEIWQTSSQFEARNWLSTNASFVLALVAIMINARLGVLLLGSLSDVPQLSYFTLSLRLSAVIVLAQTAMNVSLQPQIVRLYEQQDLAGLQSLIFVAVRTVTLVALLPTLALVFFGQFILNILGTAFVEAYPILIVLAIGQLLSAVSGPVGNLLTMTAYEKDVAIVNLAIVFLSLILLYLLIPPYQALGAAYATSISLVLRNLLLMLIAYRRLGIITIPLNWRRKV